MQSQMSLSANMVQLILRRYKISPHPNPLPKEREYLLLEIQSVLNKEREILKSRGFTDEELGSWEIELDKKASTSMFFLSKSLEFKITFNLSKSITTI